MESKICFVQKQPLNPAYNMQINERYLNLVQDGTFHAVARIYSHSPGIILAQHQSLNDLDLTFCKTHNLDITVRPTGGAAVYVSPLHTLCYSIVLNTDALDLKKDTTHLYRGFTHILESKLKEHGVPASLSNAQWYITTKVDDHIIPLIGHSMRVKKNVYQIDGIANLRSLPLDIVSKAIKMRELYDYDGEKCILVDGKYIKSTPGSVDVNKLKLIKREYDELNRMKGVLDYGLSEEAFHKIISDSITQFMSGALVKDEDLPSLGKIENVQHPTGNSEGLGHCFVVMKIN